MEQVLRKAHDKWNQPERSKEEIETHHNEILDSLQVLKELQNYLKENNENNTSNTTLHNYIDQNTGSINSSLNCFYQHSHRQIDVNILLETSSIDYICILLNYLIDFFENNENELNNNNNNNQNNQNNQNNNNNSNQYKILNIFKQLELILAESIEHHSIIRHLSNNHPQLIFNLIQPIETQKLNIMKKLNQFNSTQINGNEINSNIWILIIEYTCRIITLWELEENCHLSCVKFNHMVYIIGDIGLQILDLDDVSVSCHISIGRMICKLLSLVNTKKESDSDVSKQNGDNIIDYFLDQKLVYRMIRQMKKRRSFQIERWCAIAITYLLSTSRGRRSLEQETNLLPQGGMIMLIKFLSLDDTQLSQIIMNYFDRYVLTDQQSLMHFMNPKQRRRSPNKTELPFLRHLSTALCRSQSETGQLAAAKILSQFVLNGINFIEHHAFVPNENSTNPESFCCYILNQIPRFSEIIHLIQNSLSIIENPDDSHQAQQFTSFLRVVSENSNSSPIDNIREESEISQKIVFQSLNHRLKILNYMLSFFTTLFKYSSEARKKLIQQYKIHSQLKHLDSILDSKSQQNYKWLTFSAIQNNWKGLKSNLEMSRSIINNFQTQDFKPENSKQSNLKTCVQCGKIESPPRKLKRCANCKKVKYCSVECQKKHWNIKHKYECKT